MLPTQRDLASHELWQRSLERSRHRRELAPIVRKTASRRKRLSLAVSAAVATAPAAPSLAAVGGSPAHNKEWAKSLARVDRHTDPILLHIGVTSPAVAQLQRALHITADGIFGPQTQAAVRAYQQEHNLPPTGNVDVKTWLTLFPNDAVVATPAGWSATTSVGGPAVADAAGVSGAGVTQPVSDTSAPSSGAASDTAAGAGSASQAAGDVHAASATPAAQASAATATSAGASSAPDGGVPAGTFSSATAPQVGGGDTSGFGGGGAAVTTGGPTPQVNMHPTGTAAQLIDKMIAAANRITARHYAYSWGGGHNASFSGPYDCSGAVSAVLHAAGLLSSPMVSGDFVHWGAPGPGAVTIYANATHVYMSILGHFFGTSGSNPGGGAAWFNGAPRPGFAVVHVPFERMHLRRSAVVKAARAATRVRVRQASHVQNGSSSFASDGGTPAPSSQASDQQPTYDPPAPPPSTTSSSSSDSSASSQTSSSEASGATQSSSAPASESSGGADSSGSSSTAAASDSSSAAPRALSTPDASGSGAATSAPSESAVVSHAAPVEAPATQTATPASGGTESGGSAVSGPASSSSESHVTVSSDSGSSGSTSKASSGDSASSDSASSGQSHVSSSGSGSGSSVVKASDG